MRPSRDEVGKFQHQISPITAPGAKGSASGVEDMDSMMEAGARLDQRFRGRGPGMACRGQWPRMGAAREQPPEGRGGPGLAGAELS